MSGLKRHSSLQDLSRDHQRALSEVRSLRWLLDQDRRAQPMGEVVQSLLAFWESEALLHFREEEEVLIAFCLAHDPQFQPHADRILSDHVWLREKMAALSEAFAAGQEVQPLLAEIAQRLHDHVRYEEREAFEHVQDTLSTEQLTELGARSLAFRQQWRPPEAIGPYKGRGQ